VLDRVLPVLLERLDKSDFSLKEDKENLKIVALFIIANSLEKIAENTKPK
jgi:hypothetical protein